ncbi:FAD-binding oxidoreductase [Reyranella sp.]|uniref:FAD-binding oxidoreductase n=1 Tax=Reyranella sp. TaxID=1929291 RepID=UPI0012292D6C|nr:FAD-binding oxidoreductase [Reyranella sp.]TAJ85853.1 MAG: FAD-binding oxidoreductase [Reyranella sp.]
MNRRHLLKLAGGLPLMSTAYAQGTPFRRNRPGDPAWPSPAQWDALKARVAGQLSQVQSPLDACRAAPTGPECETLFQRLKNPWYIGDTPGLTQTSGWADAWTSSPSAYCVAARSAQDVAAAVNFAREHRLRLVVKGGGHSYQGTSCAPDSLLVWTRHMNSTVVHDAFVAQGCNTPPQPALSVGAGALWLHAYGAAAKAGRYVQGGGCLTVGVAGLIQSGGFGSFSKRFGLAAAGLLEAEVVTADGEVRIANACTNPDLFWGLKGGGGGSLGVVTRLTLRTHDLPAVVGAIFGAVKANSDAAFRRLIDRFMTFYRESLFNLRWGEQVRFRRDNTMAISMVFEGLDRDAAAAVWQPFLSWIAAQGGDYTWSEPSAIVALPAKFLWDPTFLKQNAPHLVLSDDRPGASADNIFWSSNLGEAGWFLHAYQSTWMPASLLDDQRRGQLVDALFASSRHWQMSLHFNKGLAGAPPEEIAAARDTATNPAAVEAFALAISAGEGPPAFAGIAGHEPDLAKARITARDVTAAMGELRKLVPEPGAYVSESNYFEADWQQAFWGANYPRLRAVKQKYDPNGLFFVHHGVGSEAWSADGFSRRS